MIKNNGNSVMPALWHGSILVTLQKITVIDKITGFEKNTRIYVGKCTPIIINPSLMNTLEKIFGINPITSAKKDLDIITKDF